MTPSQQLAGRTVVGEVLGAWNVLNLAGRLLTDTGGGQSTSYWVEHNSGRKGFLKAIDYTRAHSSPSPPDMLKFLADAYIFERDLCLKCEHKSLRRVVHAIDHGTVSVDDAHPFKDFLQVSFLVFDRADADIRRHLNAAATLDHVFALRVLHDIAAAIGQLHQAGLAHQDVKPSNVLLFEVDRKRTSKLADLGRAWSKDIPSPYDRHPVAGDPGYAPPELLCNCIPADEFSRRFGCDLYLLGSMIVFMFTQSHINALIRKHLDPNIVGRVWIGNYPRVLPYLKEAFGRALADLSSDLPDYLRTDLVSLVSLLCEPDPASRGLVFRAAVGRNRFAMEWFVSRLQHLHHVAQVRAMSEKP